MQTNPINEKGITITEAIKEFMNDSKKFGLRGLFRGQTIGTGKAVISLSLFHEGRMFMEYMLK